MALTPVEICLELWKVTRGGGRATVRCGTGLASADT